MRFEGGTVRSNQGLFQSRRSERRSGPYRATESWHDLAAPQSKMPGARIGIEALDSGRGRP